MGIASPPAAARNVTVENFPPQQENFLPQQENFLPQQRWQWGGWLLSFSEFPEERYTTQTADWTADRGR
jgi:hypothetical protein